MEAVENCVVGGKEEGKAMEGVEWTKVKYIPSGETLKNPSEYQLKYNNTRQVCKIRTVLGVYL
jgi:hypothetical protein